MSTAHAPLIITLGDPEGIGPEITLKAWHALHATGPAFAVAGGFDIFAGLAAALGLPPPVQVSSCADAPRVFSRGLPVLPDTPGIRAVASIEDAVARTRTGEASGLVTNPIAKSALYGQGFAFPGHTEFLAHLTSDMSMAGERGPVMMLANTQLKTVLVTIHQPLRDAIFVADVRGRHTYGGHCL